MPILFSISIFPFFLVRKVDFICNRAFVIQLTLDMSTMRYLELSQCRTKSSVPWTFPKLRNDRCLVVSISGTISSSPCPPPPWEFEIYRSSTVLLIIAESIYDFFRKTFKCFFELVNHICTHNIIIILPISPLPPSLSSPICSPSNHLLQHLTLLPEVLNALKSGVRWFLVNIISLILSLLLCNELAKNLFTRQIQLPVKVVCECKYASWI